jgi:general secretion pathway protein K
MNYITNNKGSVTILIILIAGVIMTVGLGFNWLVREHIKASMGLKNKAEAILKARSAYDTLIYLMLNGQLSEKEMMFSGVQDLTKLTSIPLNGKEVSLADDLYVKVQDSNGLLSLFNINPQAIERLIKNVAQVENPSIPVNSLLDWIDSSDFARINGAGKSYYREQQLPYQTRNYALQYKEEITFVRGIGRDIYMKIEPYLTILPSSGFNPNTAEDEVLKAYLNIDTESLNALKDYMSKTPLTSSAALFFLTGRQLTSTLEVSHFSPSRFMEITVRAGSSRSLYTIKAGLHFISDINTPYSVLYWREE